MACLALWQAESVITRQNLCCERGWKLLSVWYGSRIETCTENV